VGEAHPPQGVSGEAPGAALRGCRVVFLHNLSHPRPPPLSPSLHPSNNPAAPPRRALLLAALASAAVLPAAAARAAEAAATAGGTSPSSSSAFLPDLPAAPLPKPYVDATRRLVTTLRASITTETAGAEEFEVRRAAEPAKEAVREWVGAYGVSTSGRKGGGGSSGLAAAVEGTPSHTAVQAALTSLGRFYGSRGQRARLDAATAEAVLSALAAAEDALPPEEAKKGLKERLLGK
jgi:hypothetical protein